MIDALRQVEGTYGIAVVSQPRSGQDRRRAEGQPAAHRTRRRRVLRRQRRVGDSRAHAPGRLPRRRRDGGALTRDGYRVLDLNAARSDRQAGEPRSTGTSSRSSTAASPTSCSRRSSSSPQTIENTMRGRLLGGRRHLEARRPEPDRRGAAQRRQHHHHGVRHELALGADRRAHDRGAARASRSRSSTRRSSAIAIRSSPTRRSASSISQSGETADTLAAMREAKRRGRADARHRERRRLDDRARGRRRHLPPRRARRSASRRRRRSPARSSRSRCSRSSSARLRNLSVVQGREIIAGAARSCRRRSSRSSTARRRSRSIADEFKRRDELPVSRPRLQLPRRARGRAQAEGDQLHPRRGLSGGRDEARSDRADRREHAGRVHRAARLGVRQGRVERAGGEGARRPGHRHHEPRRAGAGGEDRLRDSASPRRSTC